MRRPHRNRFPIFSLAATIAVAILATWACMTFSIRVTGDGMMVLPAKQAKECEEGGGCQIYSKREIQAAVMGIVQGARPQQQSQRNWDGES